MYGGTDEKCMHNDHFDSRSEAKQAARMMGLSGAHKMSCHGKTVYMPGSSHGEYMDATQGGNFMF